MSFNVSLGAASALHTSACCIPVGGGDASSDGHALDAPNGGSAVSATKLPSDSFQIAIWHGIGAGLFGSEGGANWSVAEIVQAVEK
jgi:hypothetical protein